MTSWSAAQAPHPQHFDNKLQIPHRHPLPQQMLQHPMHIPRLHDRRINLRHQPRRGLPQHLNQMNRLLPRQNLRSMALTNFTQMLRQAPQSPPRPCNSAPPPPHAAPPVSNKPPTQKPAPPLSSPPSAAQSCSRCPSPCTDRETPSPAPPARAQVNPILARLQHHVISYPHRRNHQPQIQHNLPPDHRDPIQQISTLRHIHQPHQPIPHLQLHRIKTQQRLRLGGRALAASASAQASPKPSSPPSPPAANRRGYFHRQDVLMLLSRAPLHHNARNFLHGVNNLMQRSRAIAQSSNVSR